MTDSTCMELIINSDDDLMKTESTIGTSTCSNKELHAPSSVSNMAAQTTTTTTTTTPATTTCTKPLPCISAKQANLPLDVKQDAPIVYQADMKVKDNNWVEQNLSMAKAAEGDIDAHGSTTAANPPSENSMDIVIYDKPTSEDKTKTNTEGSSPVKKEVSFTGYNNSTSTTPLIDFTKPHQDRTPKSCESSSLSHSDHDPISSPVREEVAAHQYRHFPSTTRPVPLPFPSSSSSHRTMAPKESRSSPTGINSGQTKVHGPGRTNEIHGYSSSSGPSAPLDRLCNHVTGIESAFGHLEGAVDAMLVVEGCRTGVLSCLDGRPKEIGDVSLRSGSIIVFDEIGSRMRRWRDGKKWTPSRMSGPFLVYRELDGSLSDDQVISGDKQNSSSIHKQHQSQDNRRIDSNEQDNRGIPRVKEDGLIKKTISITTEEGRRYRVVSYYSQSDVSSGFLTTPSKSELLKLVGGRANRSLDLVSLANGDMWVAPSGAKYYSGSTGRTSQPKDNSVEEPRDYWNSYPAARKFPQRDFGNSRFERGGRPYHHREDPGSQQYCRSGYQPPEYYNPPPPPPPPPRPAYPPQHTRGQRHSLFYDPSGSFSQTYSRYSQPWPSHDYVPREPHISVPETNDQYWYLPAGSTVDPHYGMAYPPTSPYTPSAARSTKDLEPSFQDISRKRKSERLEDWRSAPSQRSLHQGIRQPERHDMVISYEHESEVQQSNSPAQYHHHLNVTRSRPPVPPLRAMTSKFHKPLGGASRTISPSNSSAWMPPPPPPTSLASSLNHHQPDYLPTTSFPESYTPSASNGFTRSGGQVQSHPYVTYRGTPTSSQDSWNLVSGVKRPIGSSGSSTSLKRSNSISGPIAMIDLDRFDPMDLGGARSFVKGPSPALVSKKLSNEASPYMPKGGLVSVSKK
ncbi:hypothetical protein HDU76_001584 [Blyttiomyces sp. JEL0837]|nr:hypothetical protein HDU76_001584 [Blyttiomyces sp. JEL0837]